MLRNVCREENSKLVGALRGLGHSKDHEGLEDGGGIHFATQSYGNRASPLTDAQQLNMLAGWVRCT